jgi:hypothetical protein
MPRDVSLREALRNLGHDYHPEVLSEKETEALEAALCDGFGPVGVTGHVGLPVVAKKSSLVQHQFYVREYRKQIDLPTREDDHISLSEDVPLDFIPSRLHEFFENQFERFMSWLVRRRPDCAGLSRAGFEAAAGQLLYEKPWYEMRALRLLVELQTRGGPKRMFVNTPVVSAGKLGRLVEQYYWRFRFEKSAIRGIRARAGASAGGIMKARLFQVERLKRQRKAAQIWATRPGLTKTAVAARIKQQLGASQTVKHIARCIKRH